jgi:hypothetical protein
LDVTKDPQQLLLLRRFRPYEPVLKAIYSLEEDTLTMCLNTRPKSAIPTDFDTKEDDGRQLLTLKRIPADEAMALQRNAQLPQVHFRRLNVNDDDHLTLEEFTADCTTPKAIKQATKIFQSSDRDADDKLTLKELKSKPRKASYLAMDLNADGALTRSEFSKGEMNTSSAQEARRVFELVDTDGDGKVSFQEFQDGATKKDGSN